MCKYIENHYFCDIIHHYKMRSQTLLCLNMTEEDIQNDNNICGIVTLSDSNESLFTIQHYDWDERYCYIHLKEYVGLDGVTKAISNKIGGIRTSYSLSSVYTPKNYGEDHAARK